MENHSHTNGENDKVLNNVPRELLERVCDLCEYWFTRESRTGMSESEYKTWRALGFGSKAYTELRALLTAQSAPAGEREAFDEAVSTIDPSEVDRLDGIREGWEAHAAWQRTQSAGVPHVLRYTSDGALAECPCCGSLDVGGAHDTVNCYGCGLQITKPRPLKNAASAWNKRAMLAAAPAQPAGEREAVEVVAWRYNPNDGLPHWAYTERENQAIAYDGNPTPLMTVDQHERILAAWQRTQSAGVPDFAGIGRDAGHPRAVVLYLRAEPTDDDLRAIQEALRFAAAPAQQAAPAQPEVQRLRELPPLGESLRSILGRPNFACAGIAKRLRGMGYAIPQKAEEEQAATIHWLVNLYLKHGENWATHANAALAASAGQEVEK